MHWIRTLTLTPFFQIREKTWCDHHLRTNWLWDFRLGKHKEWRCMSSRFFTLIQWFWGQGHLLNQNRVHRKKTLYTRWTAPEVWLCPILKLQTCNIERDINYKILVLASLFQMHYMKGRHVFFVKKTIPTSFL